MTEPIEETIDNPLMRLPQRMRTFVEHYVATMSGTDAILASRKPGDEISRLRAGTLASIYRKKPKVREAITWLVKQYLVKYKIDPDFVIGRLMAESMLGDDQGGSQGGRIRALELLGKWLNLFTDRNQHEDKITLEIDLNLINAARKRIKVEALSMRGMQPSEN